MKFKYVIFGIMASMLLVSCGNESSSSTTNSSNSGSTVSSSDNNSSSSSTASSHTHTFASGWEHDETYHWHKSTCGHDVVSLKTEHSFKEEVTNPTYDAEGYTTHTCTICDYSYKDTFTPSQEKTEHDKKLGITPVFDKANKTVTYGLYPQTHVNDEDTITALDSLTKAESNNWYLYNDEYYVKKSANPYESTYTFNDGTTIVKKTEYWFKCEPIEWKILTSGDGSYSLVSTVLLDAHEYAYGKTYDSGSNNYKNSKIRWWLNEDFLNSAFNLDSSLIQTTTVDNSASTTESSKNNYACANTKDKIYLLSYQDYNNTSYFADQSARMCKPTDYALANYCWIFNGNSSYEEYNGNGSYWTRSPSTQYSFCASIVYFTGGLFFINVPYDFFGVRPAITIKL